MQNCSNAQRFCLIKDSSRELRAAHAFSGVVGSVINDDLRATRGSANQPSKARARRTNGRPRPKRGTRAVQGCWLDEFGCALCKAAAEESDLASPGAAMTSVGARPRSAHPAWPAECSLRGVDRAGHGTWQSEQMKTMIRGEQQPPPLFCDKNHATYAWQRWRCASQLRLIEGVL